MQSRFIAVMTVLVVWVCSTSSIAQGVPEWAQTYYGDSSSDPVETCHNLHILMIIDTNAHDAARLGIPKDGINLLDMVKQVAPDNRFGTHNINVALLYGNDVTKGNILTKIGSLGVTRQDSLFVYYSGHGGWEREYLDKLQGSLKFDSDAGHFLALSSGTLWRWELKTAMQATNARLKILLTDCCANYPNTRTADQVRANATNTAASVAIAESTKPIGLGRIAPVLFEKLFFNHSGWVSLNAVVAGATTPGGRQGGVYSLGLLSDMQEDDPKPGIPLYGTTWSKLGVQWIEKSRQEVGVIIATTGVPSAVFAGGNEKHPK